jgi:Zn-dependent peptidase ImmA (M78 family)
MNDSKKLYTSYLETICIWLYARGFCVNFDTDGDDALYKSSKFISIKNTRSIETQLHVLLHECGHILVDKSDFINGEKEVLRRYNKKSKIYKTFTIIEEVEAWRRGLKLAKKLAIPINKEKWNRDMARALESYMKWAVN